MKVMEPQESSVVATRDPRQLSAVQLAKFGVEILNRYDLALKCTTCGDSWSPQRDSKGRLLSGYWQCPNRCNV